MENILPLWLTTGLLFIVISIPLILRKVPPNKWYGFRVPKTFASEKIWYDANQIAGYDLLYAGCAITVTALVTALLYNQIGPNFVNIINLVVFLCALIAALVHSLLILDQF